MSATATATSFGLRRTLEPLVSEYSGFIESERQLPDPIVQRLIAAGVFKLLVPRALGGGEADPVTVCRVIEDLSSIDGSIGWVAMLCSSYGMLSGLLAEEAAREIYTDPDAIVAGSLPPTGIARTVAGGYRLSGRWKMASGINHSTWLLGNCEIYEGDTPRLTPHGTPVLRVLFFPRSDVEIIDTWHVAGLRGTGSHDYQVHDIFVPAYRACTLVDEPVHTNALYALPYVTLATVLMAAVALGIARHAVDALEELSGAKTPARSQVLLREHPFAQAQIGEAEGLLRAGRAFAYQTLEEAWATVQRDGRIQWTQHGLLRLAGTQAVTQALQAVDLVYRTAGASSIYNTMPFERCLRDIRAATQHHCVTPTNYETAGQFFLGYDRATSFWGRDFRSG